MRHHRFERMTRPALGLVALAVMVAALAPRPVLARVGQQPPEATVPADATVAPDSPQRPPGLEPAVVMADPQAGLTYTCCERNIKLTGPITAAATTGVTPPPPAAATSRWVSVVFTVPISWDCTKNPVLKDCNGTVVASATSHPANAAGAAPATSAVVVKGIRKDCDGKPGKGNVLVEYSATYGGTDAVDGGLTVKIETPDVDGVKKGDIFVKLTVDVTTAGNGVKLSEPKIEKLPRR